MKFFVKHKRLLCRLFTVLFCILASVVVIQYLSVEPPRYETFSGEDKYTYHPYLTKAETKEREQIEKDFANEAKRAGSDVKIQQEVTAVYLANVKEFNKRVYEANEKRFGEYTAQLEKYFVEHPEAQNNKKVFSQYIYFTSNVELKLFNQASQNLLTITKELDISILEI